MRAIRFEGAGQADVIKLLEEPLPQLRPHDLLVRVHAAGLNRADILQRQGFYGDRPDFGDSLIPSLETAGVIAESVPKRTLSSERVSKIILLLPAIKRARAYVGLPLIRRQPALWCTMACCLVCASPSFSPKCMVDRICRAVLSFANGSACRR